jgi:hypothetical protein
MGAVPVAQHMTADEFLRLPDTDDLRSAELVEGELEIDDTLTSPQLDGFELPLAELFPG